MVGSWQVREKDQKYPLDKQLEKSSLPDRMSLWGEEEGALVGIKKKKIRLEPPLLQKTRRQARR